MQNGSECETTGSCLPRLLNLIVMSGSELDFKNSYNKTSGCKPGSRQSGISVKQALGPLSCSAKRVPQAPKYT